MRRVSTLALATVLVAGAATAMAQQDGNTYGIKAGISFFTDREMRNIFGDGQVSVGFSFSKLSLDNRWRFGTDFDLQFADRNGSKLFLAPVTVGFGRTFGDVLEQNTVPYVALRAGAAYADYSITRPTTLQRFSEKKILPTGNAELGVIFNRHFRLSARYDWFGSTDGFNFNGLKFSVAYHFFRF